MSLIDWGESFSVHNEEIDEQHKKWISIINKMHDSMLSDDYMTFEKNIEALIIEMVDFTGYHFALEEKYLLKIHYPGLADHARKHKEFNDQVAEAFRDLRSGNMMLKSNFLKMARSWLVDHIMTEDKKYSLYAAEMDNPDEANSSNHH